MPGSIALPLPNADSKGELKQQMSTTIEQSFLAVIESCKINIDRSSFAHIFKVFSLGAHGPMRAK